MDAPIVLPDVGAPGGGVASRYREVVRATASVTLGVRLEINGTEGDLLLTSETAPGKDPVGLQRAELRLTHARRGTKDFAPIETPAEYGRVPPSVPPGPPFYTAQLLVRLEDAIRTGQRASPDFADALATHQLLDLVQRASDTGQYLTSR